MNYKTSLGVMFMFLLNPMIFLKIIRSIHRLGSQDESLDYS